MRATQDGRLVLCHDPEFRDLPVATSSYQRLCLAAGQPLPCLSDVLRQFGGRAYLDIELKAPGYEAAVLDALRQSAPERGYVISSFLPHILLRLHELDTSLPLGFLCDREAYANLWRELPIRAFIPEHTLVSPKLVSEIHNAGLQLFTWTVNQQADMLQLAQWGVDGLIADDPKLLSQSFPPSPSSAETTHTKSD